jgi:uncharacterized protein (TIGR03086 family)
MRSVLRNVPFAWAAGRARLPPKVPCRCEAGWRWGKIGTVTDEVGLLSRALDQTAVVIGAIGHDQAEQATPCADWDVRALVRHLVGQDLRNFMISARGETANWQAPPEEVRADWAGEFQERAQALLDVWRAADLNRGVTVPGGGEAPLRSRADHQIAELAVHSWDLVRATGAPVTLDPALAERALAWSRRMLRPQFRGPGKAFGAEVPVPLDAPAYSRLVGWFGRDPGWTPPRV